MKEVEYSKVSEDSFPKKVKKFYKQIVKKCCYDKIFLERFFNIYLR